MPFAEILRRYKTIETLLNLTRAPMKRLVFTTAITCLLMIMATFTPAVAQNADAETIIRNMEQHMRGNSIYSEMKMTIERPRFTREVELKSWSLDTDFSLVLVTAPAREQGTVFLKRHNEIWNFVPSIDRTIKMPPSMMSQSWMGSDFNNDDLIRESSIIDDYNHDILRTETYEGQEVYVLELTPKPDAAVVWGMVRIWVTQEDYLQLRVENFDQRNELANTMMLSEIKEMGGRLIPTRFELIPADKPNQKTIMTYQAMKFDVELSPDFFTQQNMRRVR